MGIFAVFLSTIFSTTKDILSKKLAARIDGTTSTFSSFAFALPFYCVVLGVLWYYGCDIFNFSSAFWGLVVARAVTDVFAEGMKMYSFAHGDMSLVTVIFSLSPLFVLALSPVFTNDQISPGGALAVVLVVAGSVALVYRPSHPDWARQRKGILLAIGAGFFFGLNSIFDRLAMDRADQTLTGLEYLVKPAVGGFAMTAVSAVLLLPFVCFRKDRLYGMQQYHGGLRAHGFLEVAFMVCKLTAVQELAVAYVVGLHRVSLLLTIIAGRVFFKESDFGRHMMAGVLILAGVIWILWEQAN